MWNFILFSALLSIFVTVQCMESLPPHLVPVHQRSPRQSPLYSRHGQQHLKPAPYQEPYSSDIEQEEYASQGRPKAVTLPDGIVVSAAKDDNVKLVTPSGIELETYPSWIRFLVQNGPTTHVTKLGAIKVVEESGDVVFLGNTGGINWNRVDGTLITVNSTDATVTINGTTVTPSLLDDHPDAMVITPEKIEVHTWPHGVRVINPQTQLEKVLANKFGGDVNITRLDGIHIGVISDATTDIMQPNGAVQKIGPTGETSHVHTSKGLTVNIKSDGTVIQKLADGTINILKPDLTISSQFPDYSTQIIVRSRKEY